MTGDSARAEAPGARARTGRVHLWMGRGTRAARAATEETRAVRPDVSDTPDLSPAIASSTLSETASERKRSVVKK